MFKAKKPLLIIVSAVLMTSTAFLSACTTRHESTAPQYLNSTSITFKVKEGLLRDPKISSKNISVSTYKDTVTLSGSVTCTAQEERAIEIARNVRGVKYVVDNLVIKPKHHAS